MTEGQPGRRQLGERPSVQAYYEVLASEYYEVQAEGVPNMFEQPDELLEMSASAEVAVEQLGTQDQRAPSEREAIVQAATDMATRGHARAGETDGEPGGEAISLAIRAVEKGHFGDKALLWIAKYVFGVSISSRDSVEVQIRITAL
jgi:hypothetical protein